MSFAIRADASLAIGTGHVRRMLALAHALRACGADICFVCRDLGVDTAALVNAEGFSHIQLPAPASDAVVAEGSLGHAAWAGETQETDAAQTIAALAGHAPQWVVVDHYSFDATWHCKVRTALGCQIAVVDDLADRPLDCDVLIDHNHCEDHAVKYAGSLRSQPRVLGGARYALLGPDYAASRPSVARDTVQSIGIFMGGVDTDNVTVTVLDALDQLDYRGAVEIVSTGSNPNLAQLRERVFARQDTRLLLDLPSLAEFFGRHDLHIGAGGGATWERACMGAPTLGIAVARNQLEVLLPMAAQRCLVAVNMADKANPAVIAGAVKALCTDAALRAELVHNARQLLDGRGAVRAALCCMASALKVRPAAADDSAMIFSWRNHPATRAVSISNAEITWEDHARWFDRALQTPGRLLLVAQVGSVSVGVIRFDETIKGRCEVSLYLDPQLHGLGLGKAMLLAGESRLAEAMAIDARVVTGNTASSSLFASAGYTAKDPNTWSKNRGPANTTAKGAV